MQPDLEICDMRLLNLAQQYETSDLDYLCCIQQRIRGMRGMCNATSFHSFSIEEQDRNGLELYRESLNVFLYEFQGSTILEWIKTECKMSC